MSDGRALHLLFVLVSLAFVDGKANRTFQAAQSSSEDIAPFFGPIPEIPARRKTDISMFNPILPPEEHRDNYGPSVSPQTTCSFLDLSEYVLPLGSELFRLLPVLLIWTTVSLAPQL